MSSCLVIQHIGAEGPYAIADVLSAANVEVTVVTMDGAAALPETLDGYTGLVVMGGPMSADSDDRFPTRRAEIALIREAIEGEIPLLGICLGAQLLALATGGSVCRGASGLEIGWAPIRLDPAAKDDLLLSQLAESVAVFHWHGDTYVPPAGSVHLASSDRYFEQAFRVGLSAWGLQFHLEVDERAVLAFIDAFGDEAVKAGTMPDVILSETGAAIAALSPHRMRLLARFAEKVASAGSAEEIAELEHL